MRIAITSETGLVIIGIIGLIFFLCIIRMVRWNKEQLSGDYEKPTALIHMPGIGEIPDPQKKSKTTTQP